MTQYVYGVIHNSDDAWHEITIPDGADIDIQSAYGWFMEDDDAVWMEIIKLNPSDFWRGWFYWNDMEEAEEASPIEFNTREHLDLHWETNSSSGHYDCSHCEHIVDGVIVETIQNKNMSIYD